MVPRARHPASKRHDLLCLKGAGCTCGAPPEGDLHAGQALCGGGAVGTAAGAMPQTVGHFTPGQAAGPPACTPRKTGSEPQEAGQACLGPGPAGYV